MFFKFRGFLKGNFNDMFFVEFFILWLFWFHFIIMLRPSILRPPKRTVSGIFKLQPCPLCHLFICRQFFVDEFDASETAMCGSYGGTRLSVNTVVNTLGGISPLSSACTSPRDDSPLSSPSHETSSPQPLSPLAPSFSNDSGPSSPRHESSIEGNDHYSGSNEFRPAPSSRITRSNPRSSEVPMMRYDSDSEEFPSRYEKVDRENHKRRVDHSNRARAFAASNGDEYVNTDNNILDLDFGYGSDTDDSDFSHRSSLSSDNKSSIGLQVSNIAFCFCFYLSIIL
jgi:hypothetical protein